VNIGNPISSIINRALRKPGDRLNVVTLTTHERYDVNISNLNADFWVLDGENVRKWNTKYSQIPNNFHYVKEIPSHIVPDCMISGNPFVHINLLLPISRQLHIPLINIFHTEPPAGWNNEVKKQNQGFFDQCQHHVFITEENLLSWGFKDDKNCTVITHGIDSELFNLGELERKEHILTVGNDFINRSGELGYDLWKYMTQGLPVKVVGSTPGLSSPAESLDELIREYQTSRIFLNTSLRSPLPMSLIEGMACGSAVVTTNTNAICDFVTHGHDALVYSPNEPEVGRDYLVKLLNDKKECERLAQNARNTILEKFRMDDFVGKWESVLEEVCGKVYK